MYWEWHTATITTSRPPSNGTMPSISTRLCRPKPSHSCQYALRACIHVPRDARHPCTTHDPCTTGNPHRFRLISCALPLSAGRCVRSGCCAVQSNGPAQHQGQSQAAPGLGVCTAFMQHWCEVLTRFAHRTQGVEINSAAPPPQSPACKSAAAVSPRHHALASRPRIIPPSETLGMALAV